jgi:hypothetical protein
MQQIPVKFRSMRRPGPRQLWTYRHRNQIAERVAEMKAKAEADHERGATDNQEMDMGSTAQEVAEVDETADVPLSPRKTKKRRDMGHVHLYNKAATALIADEKNSGRYEEYEEEAERLKTADYPPDVQERLRPYLATYLERFARELYQKFGARVVINYAYLQEDGENIFASE